MKKQLIFLIFLSVILNANEEKIIDENPSISVYLDENPSNSKIEKMNDSFGRYERDFNVDMTKYKKVSLMDVVLETVSNSDLLKAS